MGQNRDLEDDKLVNKNINVCVATDNNYSQYASVVIASALANAKMDDYLTFYVLDGGITEENKQKMLSLKNIKDCAINFVKIDENMFEDYKNVRTHSYITLATFYRLKLPTLLPDVHRVIYFDCDFVINSSLRDLFNKNLGKNPVAGVQDINKKFIKHNPNYVNAGMLVMDLDNFRSQNVEELFLNWTKEHIDTIKLGDQEIINEALKGRIALVEDVWNVQSSNFTNRSSYTNSPKAIHFVAKKKPWHWASFSYHRNLYFKYLQLTPWKLSEKDYKHWTIDNQKASIIEYIKYRPVFFLRPRFYKAIFETYIKPLFSYKKPIIKNNTFIVWEPCSKSHSEVVPGYCKYLLGLGYEVSVITHPDRIKEGLFSRFKNEKLFINKLSKKQVEKFFKNDDLADVAGVLVTTVGKLCDEIHFDEAYKTFNKNVDKSKILFVSHESKHAVDNNSWKESLITLRELNYKGAKSVVVNPHYFGDVKYTPKNPDITNFITIGAIQGKKKNNELIINSVENLVNKGYKNFKVTVVGKGSLKHLPKKLQPYFDIKGRLPFNKMYDELEKADFMLTSYDVTKPLHIRYNTTGTSGNFQLVYGFLKPCLIVKSFAPINRFDDGNSIIYDSDEFYIEAMEKCINMSADDYEIMQNNLKDCAKNIYNDSLNNLKEAING